ncbi:MAG: nucleotidyltransferase [Firmicutes bacterium]|nr:nucleotidyltransferase [Bacillota bacterium]
MEVIGIICEYNPFHNGHLYHINKIKEMYENSLIVLIISGYFTQRGNISILSKEDKTKISLLNNVDIVLELPFIYSTQSADVFAESSIKILNELKITKLVFGSECDNINTLKNIVNIQLNNDTYDNKVKEYLDKGENYPTAMAKALNINKDIFFPNNLLGISYIKAIIKNNYNIEPIVIKRTNDFHDLSSNDNIISASNIRNKINNGIPIENYVPNNVTKFIKNVNYDKLFELLKSKIITEDNLSKFLTVDEGIDNKLKKVINNCNSVEELIQEIKTKRYTYNKLNRMFIHILIGVLKEDNKIPIDYIKVLGFNSTGKKYLNKIKKEMNISLLLNHKSKLYNYELRASLIYDMLTNSNSYKFELENKPIII